jgi:hypothetical protein
MYYIAIKIISFSNKPFLLLFLDNFYILVYQGSD